MVGVLCSPGAAAQKPAAANTTPSVERRRMEGSPEAGERLSSPPQSRIRCRKDTSKKDKPDGIVTYRLGANSRREPFDVPAIGLLSPVAQPVVQAVGPALPELDRQRPDAEAAPERRARHLALREALGQLAGASFENLAAGNDLALP